MALESNIDLLKARIVHLEDSRRYIQNSLEMVLSLEDFYTEIGGDQYCLDTLLPEAKRRIDAIFPFEVLAFYMVDESDFSFQPAFRHPDHLADMIQQEVAFMIDKGYFAWAIRERRGVVISSKDHDRQYLLHVIANHNQVKGMFGGLLPSGHTSLPDTAMTLLSIIMLHVANATESMAYTSLLKNQSLLLERQVAERTKALTRSQRELEQAMTRANILAEEAQAASLAKGDFLAKMSHELRTPLNGILGMTEVALSTRLDENQRRIIEIIGRESFSLLRQINDVLDFSKIESGKLELEQIDFDLRTLMEEIGESFVFQTSEKGVELNIFVDPSVPTELVGDPVRLRQILLNLAGNAVKFTHEGEILIEAKLDQPPGERVLLRFSIIDTGIGIDPEKVDRVFSSFTQVDDSTTRQYGGTGLGTTISKQLVELMGGHIGVDSRPGKGSTFWFTAEFGMRSARMPLPADDSPRQSKRSLLVVDNSTTTCRILSAYLGQLGMHAVTANDGETAVALLGERTDQTPMIDVIITDARMPGMNGVALKDHIRRMPSYARTPIIVATSLKEMVEGRDYVALGFDGSFSKPVKIGELQAVLDRVTRGGTADKENTTVPLTQAAIIDRTSRRATARSGHILVADDYLTNQQVAFMHLTAAGYTVDVADNGQQAMDAFDRTRYDLILMDIQMPILNGFDATGKIRALEAAQGRKRRTPIIALTANAMKGDEKKCLDAGMDGYLIKPVHRHQLIKTADHWISLRKDSSRSQPMGNPVPPTVAGENDDVRIMDVATAVEEFGDAETVKTVADQLIELVAGQLEVIRKFISTENREGIRKEAHAIKGGAATMEAAALSAAAARLEARARDAEMVDIRADFDELKKQYYYFREFIAQWKGAPDHANFIDR
ncbi:response regulator [uncultured Desulfosarcina sp.]|uniref:response regulator n=1 Tax=uncultured Desulfosarcina sp. TaxID=218289 RepID=UPI0029C98DA1|nr:response regulator [uncultured Desulfosarcina sp.]